MLQGWQTERPKSEQFQNKPKAKCLKSERSDFGCLLYWEDYPTVGYSKKGCAKIDF